MAKHGVYFEKDNLISTQCITRSGLATVDVDGGNLVIEGLVNTKDRELYNVTLAAANAARVGVAYNPAVKYEIIGGELFPNLSEDDRNYTNPADKPLNYFFPKVGIVFGIQGANIEGDVAPVVGKFLEATADGKFAIKDAQTADVASFLVEDITNARYVGVNGFEDEVEAVYILKCVANG